jgi:general secretion pathway protein N
VTRKRVLIVLGILLYLGFVIATLPARALLTRVLPDAVSIDGIEGSIWSGSAASLVAGKFVATNIVWDFQQSRLFRLQAAYHLSLEIPGGFARGIAAIGPGALSLFDVSAAAPVAELARLVAPMNLKGQASVEISETRLVDMWPEKLDAVIRLGNVFLLKPSESRLGDYRVIFDTAAATDAALVGMVEDVDGPLDVAGRVLLLPERGYEVDLRILPEPQLQQQFDRMLRLVPKDNDGRYQLSLSGKL